ncbi:plasmid partitioning protein RepB C-terminal domain-containing protein [Acidisoma sp. L85]|uniref:plasmid partitioning protein RepB C-terminal domain-containing protein n=1 Tax=Acidisoma sp. L85 TaxID=1641850 RepID=UPI001C207674|nr:plasmid partitioning protein RepB C-terminal domain-containing protein [Acidisoma sp. L85]
MEPLVVSPLVGFPERWLLLDGHIRLAVLHKLGRKEARCLIATEDEGFTYNKRVNHLATVQEHLMIVRALERGVEASRIAAALNIDLRSLNMRRQLLNGICPEVVELLKDKMVGAEVFSSLRKMKPLRQITVAELMIAGGNLTSTYARALLSGTRATDLKDVQSTRRKTLSPEQLTRMNRESEALQADYRNIEHSYGEAVLDLFVATGYIAKLLRNIEVERYLMRKYPELAEGLSQIVSAAAPEHGLAA